MVRVPLRDFVAAVLWPSAGTIYFTNFKTSANHLNVQRHKLKSLVWYSEQDKHWSSNSARWTGSIQTVTTTTTTVTNHFCNLSSKKGLFQVFLKQQQQRGHVDSSYNIKQLTPTLLWEQYLCPGSVSPEKPLQPSAQWWFSQTWSRDSSAAGYVTLITLSPYVAVHRHSSALRYFQKNWYKH